MPQEIHLHMLPSFALSLSDGKADQSLKVLFRLSDDARAFVINAVTTANKLYAAAIEEHDLLKILNAADASLDWSGFLHAMDNACANKQISVNEAHDVLTLQFKVGNGNATFTLSPVNESNGSFKFMETLFELFQLRNDEKSKDNILKDMQKKIGDLGKKEQQLKDDTVKAQQQQTQAQEEEKLKNEEHEKLTKELRELQGKTKKEKPEDLFVPQEPDLTKWLGRRTLLEDARTFDSSVLKLIKSKYTPFEDGADSDEKAKHMKVIRPFTKSEFESQLRNLQEDQRKLVLKCFEKLDNWDFDVFTLQDFTDRGSLFHTAYALFVRHDFMRKFNLDEQIVVNFLSQVEAGYHPNPYHNSMHAADVLHILHFICTPGGLYKTARLTDHDLFAALVAGMIHDYDHPGINNGFHAKVQSYLATLYNDRSILENHHCAEVFDFIKNPMFNIFQFFTEEQRRDMRETIIEMVLSTDMGLHAKILGTWKRRIQQDVELYNKKEDQRLALSMAIKMADVSNCGRPESIYLRWAYKISEEFALQGDRERNLGGAISPFMDRYVPAMAKGQIAFMNFVIIPLFESISEYLPEMHFTIDHCEQNKGYWAANDDTV